MPDPLVLIHRTRSRKQDDLEVVSMEKIDIDRDEHQNATQTQPRWIEQRVRSHARAVETLHEEKLSDILQAMLLVSKLIFTFASIRRFAKQEELRHEDLILAPLPNDDDDNNNDDNDGTTTMAHDYNDRVIKRNISAHDVHTFITANIDILQRSPQYNDMIGNSGEAQAQLLRELNYFRVMDAELYEFDDRFETRELVYAITINRTERRITVIFRGSVMGGKDWSTNFSVAKSTLDVPEQLQEEFDFKERIRVHAGFKAYLFKETVREDNDDDDEQQQQQQRGPEKFEEIVTDLNNLYNNTQEHDYRDYALYVTGHSLGGALSQLVAFELAASVDVPFPRPITAVTFGSPYVGGEGFRKAFAVLEKNGLVRHLRVSNQHDLIPLCPPLANYTHTGINLHLKPKGEYELGYRNLKSIVWAWNFNAHKRHTLTDYAERMEMAIRMKGEDGSCDDDDYYALENITIGELYRDERIVGDFTA